MSKHKGALRYTDKATGRPVFDIPKDILAAHLGINRSATSKRAESRWMQGAHGAGKGDMKRPQSPQQKDSADENWLWAFCSRYKDGDETCACVECRTHRN